MPTPAALGAPDRRAGRAAAPRLPGRGAGTVTGDGVTCDFFGNRIGERRNLGADQG